MTADEEPTTRLFVALPIPPEVRRHLEVALPREHPADRDLRWTRPDGWHVTLAFVGDVTTDRVDRISDLVRRTLWRTPVPDRLVLGRPGRFGDHVLWIAIRDEPPGAVAHLGSSIQQALAAAGIPVTQRRVDAHVTLARSRRGGSVTAAAVKALAAAPIPRATWVPDRVEVWQSHLGDGPARYSAVTSLPKVGGHRDGT